MNKGSNQSQPTLNDILVSEGVTENDMQWWQGMSREEKQRTKDSDAEYRLAFLTACMQDMHLSKDEALLKTMASFAFYDEYPLRQGVLHNMVRLGLSKNDYPLPYELHSRIDEFLIRLLVNETMLNDFKQQKTGFPTMNALLRHKVKSGEI